VDRYTGTIEPFADIDVSEYVDWVKSVPSDKWYGFQNEDYLDWGPRFWPLARMLTAAYFPGCGIVGIGMFLLKPGQIHPAHVDDQPPEWRARIHVPLITNSGCVITMDDGDHFLEVGKAYKMNTLSTHRVENRGTTPRLNFMFDLKG
jgi:hypothetical protein